MTEPLQLQFRAAVRADLPAVVALLADDPLGRAREDASAPLSEVYSRAFEEMLAQGGNRLLVAETPGPRGHRIAGCLQLVLLPGVSLRGTRRAQIEGVRVASDLRGSKVGQQLLEHALEQARDAGCGLVQLTCDVQRADAHRFYESLGFAATHVGFKLRL